MRCRSWPIIIFAIACGLLANTAPARALSAETWVSGTGSNAAPCPITAPCKTFQFAHNRTSDGGAINVLSPGNFGPLTITKSISIVADGVAAVINAGKDGAAIIVNGSNIVVSLRGLTIDMRGTGNIGISFLSGAALHVQNSVIRRSTNGIRFAPASGTSQLHGADSAIANSSSDGIYVAPTASGSARAVLDRVRVKNGSSNGIGFSGAGTTGSIIATVRDSVAASNPNTGIYAVESGSGTTAVMIDRSASVNNGTGIVTNGANATIRIGDSTVNGNTTGLNILSGVIRSYGTNKVNGNGTDGEPTSLILMK